MEGAEGLALWGCPWRPKHRKYADLASWQRECGQDINSRVADPRFVEPSAGDWRVKPEGPARALGAGWTGR